MLTVHIDVSHILDITQVDGHILETLELFGRQIDLGRICGCSGEVLHTGIVRFGEGFQSRENSAFRSSDTFREVEGPGSTDGKKRRGLV